MWLRCESDRLMCFKIENQQQISTTTAKKKEKKKNSFNNNNETTSIEMQQQHRNNYLPHNFITYISSKETMICRACIKITRLHDPPLLRSRLHGHRTARSSERDILTCINIYKALYLAVKSSRCCFGTFILLGTFNNYRLTDSIIQTTWNVKLPYFLKWWTAKRATDRARQSDWQTRATHVQRVHRLIFFRLNDSQLIFNLNDRGAITSRSIIWWFRRTLISFIGHRQSHSHTHSHQIYQIDSKNDIDNQHCWVYDFRGLYASHQLQTENLVKISREFVI